MACVDCAEILDFVDVAEINVFLVFQEILDFFSSQESNIVWTVHHNPPHYSALHYITLHYIRMHHTSNALMQQ